jgi:HK97 family phage prohead protease
MKITKSLEQITIAEEGIIKGYASVFNNVDDQYEVVQKGAYKRSIDHHKGHFPIFGNHKVEIGATTKAFEDDYGLYIEGKLFIEDIEDAQKISAIMKARKSLGIETYPMSIGILVKQSGFGQVGQEPVRVIKEARILEVTLTPIAANELASTIKQLDEVNIWYDRCRELTSTVEKLESELKSLKNSSFHTRTAVQSLEDTLDRYLEKRQHAN